MIDLNKMTEHEKLMYKFCQAEIYICMLQNCLEERINAFWGDWKEEWKESFRNDPRFELHPVLRAEAVLQASISAKDSWRNDE